MAYMEVGETKDGVWVEFLILYIHGLVQERCNSSVLAMELHLSCINPSRWVSARKM